MSEQGTGNREQVYQRAIDTLTSQGKFYINLGLERVQAVLELLGDPQKKLKFIHVAGTNGKGSVCAMLSAVLKSKQETGKREQGTEDAKMQRCNDAKNLSCSENCSTVHPLNLSTNNLPRRVGLFTSPHVYEYTERIKINDVEIDKETFAQKLLEIVDLADKNEIHLTEFEILTVLAFEYFAQNQVDIVVLETGLGGRLDATNVIDENLCSIITHIDLDHTERLGDTIEKIASEKAGIIKENCPVVTAKSNAGLEIIRKVADEKKSELFGIPSLCHYEEQSDEAIQGREAIGRPRRNCVSPHSDEFVEFLSLKGAYQRENLALVLGAIDILKEKGFEITDAAIEQGLKNIKHPCRFEYRKENNLIIDGAHNPDGARVLRESLEEYFPNQSYRFIFGCLRNKDYPQMMKNLFREGDEIMFYHFDNENSCTVEELSSACEFSSKPFEKFSKCAKLTVICGSFYMIKELFSKETTAQV